MAATIWTDVIRTTVCLASGSISSTDRSAQFESLRYVALGRAKGSDFEGLTVRREQISGFDWPENTGLIAFGNGDDPYTNTRGMDLGMNVSPLIGHPTGCASWGKDIGRIGLGVAEESSPARIEGGRLHGFA